MSASLKPLTLGEFLAWDERQQGRYEFDGIQPVAMTGGTRRHARIVKRAVAALNRRLPSGCEAFPGDRRVGAKGNARFPDVVVLCGDQDQDMDDGSVNPILVIEVMSPSTQIIDRRVKPAEYAQVSSIQVYVLLAQDRPEAILFRRAAGWVEEGLEGSRAVLALPEVGVEIPLAELYEP